jgi:squalene-hopene/tetraprenyl-beta-curcumene cyclase
MATELAPQIECTAEKTLRRAQRHLLDLQHEAGWWKGALDTNVTMDAEDLLLREFLGIRDEGKLRLSANWIRSQQRPDGSWATFEGGPPELSTTTEAYVALRLAGDPPEAAHMARAAELARDLGGLERCRIFTRIWMALFGLWSWRDLPALPPEVILLPTWFPLNIYEFGCWARQTIVPLTIVAAHRPARPLGFGIDELRTGAWTRPRGSLGSVAGRLLLLDHALQGYERRPLRRLRRHAIRLATTWIVKRQEADGCWGGIQPPWVYSMMALSLEGYPLEHPVLQRALAGLDEFTIVENGMRRLEACQSPVWDTALAVVGLADSGLPADHPALLRAADWLLDREIRVQGDWGVKRPDLAPGGWAFEFHNVNYPDIDDTAEVVLALRKVAHPDRARIGAAIDRAVNWTLGMQSRNHAWGAFDVDNLSTLCRDLPFCDFGEVTDPPSADVTAHVVEMLAREGFARDARVARARDWLLAQQEAAGSWFGRWGANYLYGTGAVLPALAELGESSDAPAFRRAVRWLEAHQNPDGGWGEDLRSYRNAAWEGRGESIASQTAWALLALLAAGEHSAAVEGGVAWLVEHQREDGGWDEPQFTGTGFPGDFYINYHLYRLVFPLAALGRYVKAAA